MDSEQITHPIVLACDGWYAMPLATTLRSIVQANQSSWPLEFHVLTEGFTERARRKVVDSLPQGSVSIRWVAVDLSRFGDFAGLPHTVSKMTYSRLLIPSIFRDTVSKVLYLDTDLVVLDDLGELWDIDLEESVVGAVLDRWDQNIKRGDKLGDLDLSDVPRVKDYFNAGVLVIDLDRWREKRISEKALDYLTRYPLSPFADQDALNVACDGVWKKLHPRWNFQNHFEQNISSMQSKQRPGIIHFVGKEKPWNASIPNINARFYDAIRSQTCFPRTQSDRLWDALKGCRFRLNAILWRYAGYRIIRRHIKFALHTVAIKLR
jgi:lipopolysaccharide biosynthesis glycosyltransferase